MADLIEEEELGGGLGLVFAVAYELAAGAASPWAGYLASLPEREYVPFFWADEELAELAGTELQDKPQADRQLAREDYDAHVAPLLARHPKRLPAISYELFSRAASLVASRAFGVDDWHGAASAAVPPSQRYQPALNYAPPPLALPRMPRMGHRAGG